MDINDYKKAIAAWAKNARSVFSLRRKPEQANEARRYGLSFSRGTKPAAALNRSE